ncbi:hypothetical protein PVIIG_05343 [Plasmodium vivax India VII]|uniref:PIR Superfamily Protein n=1 Tax=Plasmodium vivax India VII TaxID=1077284 RepID=A0A0J9UUK5_PLAVI|nr:hypothetical protein PVIIG_05343 [Plasmodium vivax India VII]
MSETGKDDFFEKLENEYAFLRIYPLGKLYSSFLLNNNADSSFDPECKDLLKKDSACDLRSICISAAKLLLGLKVKFDQNPVPSFAKECEYLNYWIYHIMKNYSQCDNIELFYERLNGIKSPFIPKGHSCDIQDFKIGTEVFHLKKALFFHAEILDWIKTGYEDINQREEILYNKYLNECLNIYNGIICNIISEKKENYDELLEKFRINFNDAITFLEQKGISIWHTIKPLENERLCPNKLQRNRAGSELPAGQKAPVALSGLLGEEEPRVPVRRVELEVPGKQGMLVEPQGLSVEPEVLGPRGTPYPVEEATLSDQGNRDQDSNGNFSEEVRPNKIIYSYGSWINTKVLGKNKPINNMEKNHYELLLNGVGNREMSLNDTMYHISYNSAAN